MRETQPLYLAAGADHTSSFLRLTFNVMTTYSFIGGGVVEKIDESSKCIDRHKTCLKEKIQGRKRWFEFWKHATFSVSKSDF